MRWSPSATDKLLLAGTERSIPVLRAILASLPAKARGQVFVEVASADDIDPIAGPGRVMVCWLLRDRGQSLQRSVDSWLSEMLPTEFDREHNVYAWVDGAGAARTLSSN
ncbi:SIP domain-containing protein [Lacisediminihabitans sp. G11-30]|uniref:SIP domain-containing protein n=1 Tax=Lacisediminihabitans changchengi TaxID=2787634 RepID=A0A934SSS2_9MICO|nr:SIP domain-containing protein [Lacisediminihabitans changchengi]